MDIKLKLVKNCKNVDKYQAVDAKGAFIEENPPVGPIYLDKKIVEGAESITLTVKATK